MKFVPWVVGRGLLVGILERRLARLVQRCCQESVARFQIFGLFAVFALGDKLRVLVNTCSVLADVRLKCAATRDNRIDVGLASYASDNWPNYWWQYLWRWWWFRRLLVTMLVIIVVVTGVYASNASLLRRFDKRRWRWRRLYHNEAFHNHWPFEWGVSRTSLK